MRAALVGPEVIRNTLRLALEEARVSPVPVPVQAIVSRGGRPDLAGPDVLSEVQAPTLLVTGGLDANVIELNRAAFALLECAKDLVIVPGAPHLFEEPGTLEAVARLAVQWFERYLGKTNDDARGNT